MRFASLRLAIEYDGEHHFTVANGGTAESLAQIQARDAWKDALLRAHHVKLIRISGWPIDIGRLLRRLGRYRSRLA